MSNIIRAWTGPSVLSADERLLVETFGAVLRWPDEVRTGCAHGVDTVAASLYDESVLVHLFVPSASHNEKLVAEFKRSQRNPDYEFGASIRITKCPRATVPALAYRIRNQWMIAGTGDIPPATELCAVVRKPTFYRSGEWMTINIAKQAGIPVKFLDLRRMI